MTGSVTNPISDQGFCDCRVQSR